MPSDSVFHMFRPHDEIVVDRIDRDDDTVGFRSRWSGHPGLSAIGALGYSVKEDDVVQVQFGKVPRMPVGSVRRHAVGASRVSAHRHHRPQITRLGLAVMRWSLGDDSCSRQLSYYAERANTLQTDVTYEGRDGTPVSLLLSGGCIRAEFRLTSTSRVMHQGIRLSVRMPETLALSMKGAEVEQLLEHTLTRGAGLVVDEIMVDQTGTYVRLMDAPIDVTDAISALRDGRAPR